MKSTKTIELFTTMPAKAMVPMTDISPIGSPMKTRPMMTPTTPNGTTVMMTSGCRNEFVMVAISA